jgi:hypothetical protein
MASITAAALAAWPNPWGEIKYAIRLAFLIKIEAATSEEKRLANPSNFFHRSITK